MAAVAPGACSLGDRDGNRMTTPVSPPDDVAREICDKHQMKLHGLVGAGAFKWTYHVTTASGTQRALKIYKATGSRDRTDREVAAITRCNHGSIVRFETIQPWQPASGAACLFSIEEFLAGGTLASRLKSGVLNVDRVAQLAGALVAAVGHIAGLDLVHRDLKPDNIMFGDDGWDPIIVDFGLVRDLAESSLTQTWAAQGPGTPFFAAPEQLNNEKALIDWRTDQFAIGVVLCCAATGRHPYQHGASPPGETVELVAKRGSVSPEFVQWATAARLEQIRRMVAAWPVERFRTPTELADAWSAE